MSTKELVREWQRATKKALSLQGKLLHIHVETTSSNTQQRDMLETTGGALRSKIKINAVTWQRRIREAWGR